MKSACKHRHFSFSIASISEYNLNLTLSPLRCIIFTLSNVMTEKSRSDSKPQRAAGRCEAVAEAG